MSADAFAVLGLDPEATADDVRAARRRLAKQLHPDRMVGAGVDERQAAAQRLARINRAADVVLADLAARAARPPAEPPPPGPAPPTADAGTAAPADVFEDVDEDETTISFSVDVLPVEAFELLFLALFSIGEPKVVDEPYLLEGVLDDPALGLCHIELVPEAGGSIVTVEVRPMARSPEPPPTARAVAGRLLAEMQTFGLGDA